MTEVLRLASFLIFLGLGFRVARRRDGEARRKAVNALLIYVLALSGAVGILQRNDWPFGNHMLAVGVPRLDVPSCRIELYGVDGEDREWRVDPHAWSPVSDWTLQLWFMRHLGRLSEGARAHVLPFLYTKAEEARHRLAAGQPVGNERRLGAILSAPYWWLLPRAPDVPASPYAGLRIYEACWVPRERLVDPGRVTRTTVAEYAR